MMPPAIGTGLPTVVRVRRKPSIPRRGGGGGVVLEGGVCARRRPLPPSSTAAAAAAIMNRRVFMGASFPFASGSEKASREVPGLAGSFCRPAVFTLAGAGGGANQHDGGCGSL